MKENVFSLGMIFIRRERIITAVVFALTIFAQCVLFHYLIYKEILFSTLWHSPVDFFRFYLPHISIALFFSSFVFLFKRRWWIIALSLLFDIWILANLWYYRAFGILIDNYAVSMIGNLSGYWDSCIAFIRTIDFVFPLFTIILIITIVITKCKTKSIKLYAICFALALLTGLANGLLLVKKYHGDWSNMNPMKSYSWDTYSYVHEHSVIHQLGLITTEIKLSKEERYQLTDIEISNAHRFFNASATIQSEKRLIIFLIESLNTFVIKDEFMPNLSLFLSNSNLLFAPNITSQTKSGVSSDGQLIVQTGLLPLNSGAASLRFPFNTYPALSHLFSNSACILPHDVYIYNQALMSRAYGINNNVELSDNDSALFSLTVKLQKQYNNVLILTGSTHIPCTKYADNSDIFIPDSVPTLLRNYIKSANVVDKGIKILLDSIESNENLKNSTIVFTGDHCLPVSSEENFNNIYNYSRFIPLIIYSPEIKQKTVIPDTCYQMDIYPTILHLIGCEDYYWKGFGVNLLDSSARHNRPITPEEAYDLSDKLIRADFFKKYPQ